MTCMGKSFGWLVMGGTCPLCHLGIHRFYYVARNSLTLCLFFQMFPIFFFSNPILTLLNLSHEAMQNPLKLQSLMLLTSFGT